MVITPRINVPGMQKASSTTPRWQGQPRTNRPQPFIMNRTLKQTTPPTYKQPATAPQIKADPFPPQMIPPTTSESVTSNTPESKHSNGGTYLNADY
ncbi:MAG: hypothetical protein R3C11_10995 [Planctomycetaceae bacterium]